MLKNIPKNLSPELLKILCEMGHGDEIVMEVDNKRIEKIRIIITEKSSEESGNDRED